MYLFNTDFSGFRDFLDMIDHNFNNKEVLILGSGGSSKAIAYSLKLLNIKYHIVSRSLRDNTISYNDVPNFSSKIGMVINTTPVGMPPYENAELPIKWHELVNLQTVINLGYGPAGDKLSKTDLKRLRAKANKMKKSTKKAERDRGNQLIKQVNWANNFGVAKK